MAFDEALRADRRGAGWAGRAPATLRGSFGSGEGYFMLVRYALLRDDVDARSRPELARHRSQGYRGVSDLIVLSNFFVVHRGIFQWLRTGPLY
ncbi:MAG: hypothetical protein M3Y48_05765 [Actinomycetota bacterium]|nr:hypothetical protein [Actinomycetota bacterium]